MVAQLWSSHLSTWFGPEPLNLENLPLFITIRWYPSHLMLDTINKIICLRTHCSNMNYKQTNTLNKHRHIVYYYKNKIHRTRCFVFNHLLMVPDPPLCGWLGPPSQLSLYSADYTPASIDVWVVESSPCIFIFNLPVLHLTLLLLQYE